MNWWALAGAVLSGTALATALGKLIDLLWLEPLRLKADRLRWLREARLEAYASLSEEILSMGIRSEIVADYQLFRAKAARAELLTDDTQLLADLRKFSTDLLNFSRGGTMGFKITSPADLKVTLEDGTVLGKKELEKVLDYESLEERANELVDRLGRIVRGT